MSSKVFVSGSLAYDVLMNFDGTFSDHILADKISSLSVSFFAKNREIFFGGCGGNIAYGLSKFDIVPYLFGNGGNDFGRYLSHLNSIGVECDSVVCDEKLPTASAFILSDNDANQIAMFSPGAMESNSDISLSGTVFDFAILAPLLPERMVAVGRALQGNSMRYLLDPGQALVSLTKEQLEFLISGAHSMVLNEYESELFEKKMGCSLSDFDSHFDFVVVTLGENGSEVRRGGVVTRVAALSNLEVVDPTGCGDSFRAGFIAALQNGQDLSTALKWGNVIASFCLEVKGSQSYDFSLEDFNERLRTTYP